MTNEQNTTTIFLVDDEPIQNEMLKDYLAERFSYQIKTFESGESAIREIGLKPHIVVLDFHLNSHLPDAQNGVEVLKRIKELSPESQVIMLSGQDKLEVAVESMKYGAYDYVVKGETAFSRMENVINNILELSNIKELNQSYKRAISFLQLGIVAVILISIILVYFVFK
jgi:DNA-binding NtrC family response regulator